jgi:hypothetical protein
MKKINKKKLDSLIKMEQLYWRGNNDIMPGIIALSGEIEKESKIGTFAPEQFISAIVKPNGFNPDASNELIYTVLQLLGWEVVSE